VCLREYYVQLRTRLRVELKARRYIQFDDYQQPSLNEAKIMTGQEMARTRANTKPRFKDNPTLEELEGLISKVKYAGNPAHKRNSGDFGLTPPSSPRPDKTLCDGSGVFEKAVAEKLLKEGIQKGMISAQQRNGFPQHVWAVSESGIPLEGQLENELQGTYHGYPILPDNAALWEMVIRHWRKAPLLP
jgi:hypothetical protein